MFIIIVFNYNISSKYHTILKLFFQTIAMIAGDCYRKGNGVYYNAFNIELDHLSVYKGKLSESAFVCFTYNSEFLHAVDG